VMVNKPTVPADRGDDTQISRVSLVPIPNQVAELIRLANLVPQSERRSAGNGIHVLTQRSWAKADEEQAARSVPYLQMYLRDWPLALKAFVLWDTYGLYVEIDGHSAPLQDYSHLQVRENISLLDDSDSGLHMKVETANERLRQEIAFVENRSSSQTNLEFATTYVGEPLGLLGGYDVGECKFEHVGISQLALRARQRFFFVLAAEELLFALTERIPQNELDQLWYVPECDLFSGGLYVENDRLHVLAPALFSFLLGIPISRIHRCIVCSDYFWAGRKDKSVCSARCGATKRKRKERKRYEEIKLGDRVPKKRVNVRHGTKKG
jgi:hypothetical protein